MFFRAPLTAATPVTGGTSQEAVGGGLWGALFSKVTSGSIPTWCGFAAILVAILDMIVWLPFVHAFLYPGEADAVRTNSFIALVGIAIIGFRKNAKEKGWNDTVAQALKVFYDTSIDTSKFIQSAPPALQRALLDLQAKADAGEIPHPTPPPVAVVVAK